MSGLLPLFGAGVAVFALVLLSGWFGFRGQPRLEGPEEAALIAQTLPGGYTAVHIILDSNGHAALLADTGGRVALIGAHGAHFIAREIDRAAFARCEGEVIALRTGGLEARLALGPDAGRWLKLLHQAGASA